MTENINDEIYKDIASYKWKIEEKSDTIKELIKKIENLEGYYDYIGRIRKEKTELINSKILRCTEEMSTVSGGVVGAMYNARDRYDKLLIIDENYYNILRIIKKNIEHYEEQITSNKNEINEYERKIENCYKEIEKNKE